MANAKDSAAGDGLIIPAKIPGDDLSPEKIRAAATSLIRNATAIQSAAGSVDTSWSALPASFVAPDAHIIYAAMTPASASARTFAGKLDRIAKALNTFADQLDPVKSTLKGIKKDAVAFLKDFDAQHRVWVDASATKKYEFDDQISWAVGAAYAKSAQVHGSGAAIPATPAPVTYLRGKGEIARLHNGMAQIKASWLESSWHVDQNNQLLDRVADAYAKVSGYEVECGNSINNERDDCAVPLTAVEAWQLKQSGANTADLPWGHRVDEDRNCGESALHGFSTAAIQTWQGLLGLVAGYDPMRNEFWRGDAYGSAWTSAITGLGSLGLAISPSTWVLAGLGVPFAQDAMKNTGDMLKGLVAWDEWSKNPSEALGATIFNIGTFFIPGAGEVGLGVKALTVGTKLEMVANAIAKVEEVTSKITKMLPDNLGKLFGDGLDTKVGTPGDIHIHVPETTPHLDAPGAPHLPGGHSDHGSAGDTVHSPTSEHHTPMVDRPTEGGQGHPDTSTSGGSHGGGSGGGHGAGDGSGHGGSEGSSGGHAGSGDSGSGGHGAEHPGGHDGSAGHDGGESTGGGGGSGGYKDAEGWHPVDSGQVIPLPEYEHTLAKSVHNAESADVMLGKYDLGGDSSYITQAERAGGYSYFDMGSDWGRIQENYGLSDNEMFHAFNEPFLKDAVAEGKSIHFSHDPELQPTTEGPSFLTMEFEFMKKQPGYEYVKGAKLFIKDQP